MRQTSVDAYNTIQNNGLLSKRRWEVYDYIYKHGPVTCRQTVKAIAKQIGEGVSVTYSSYSSRFSELKRLGVVVEVGTVLDEETNNTVILWDVTDKVPNKWERPKTSKEIIQELEQTISYLETENSQLKEKLSQTGAL